MSRLKFNKGVNAVEYLEDDLISVGLENGELLFVSISNLQLIMADNRRPLICGSRINKIRRYPERSVKKFALCSNDHTTRIYSYSIEN